MIRKLVILFFIIQLVAIIYTKFSPEKYFGWVPYDQISTYEVHVKIGERELSDLEVSERYNIANPGRENRAIVHVFSRISQYEETYGLTDSAFVKVIYSINGREEEIWVYSR